MPIQQDQRALQRLARDLFRHLDDTKHLRRNILVSEYFVSEKGCEFSERETLLEIRSALVSAARLVYSQDTAGGRKLRADRTFAIISGLCNGRSAKQIADD